jgi:GntR family transcriptional regulator, arabinose operon transcriptional repressor
MSNYIIHRHMKKNDIHTISTKAFRVVDRLETDIREGKYRTGVLLPSEEELSRTYEVSRMTMRKSLGILSGKRPIERLPQGGTLVPRSEPAKETPPTGQSISTHRTERKPALAVIQSRASEGGNAKIFEGMQDYCEAHNLDFLFYLSPEGHDKTLDMLEHIQNLSIDGILIFPYPDEKYLAILNALTQKKFPIVSQLEVTGHSLNTVMSNDRMGYYQATTYLIEKYHRPVYHIKDPGEVFIGLERFEGYKQAMLDAEFGANLDHYIHQMEVGLTDPKFWGDEKAWFPGYHAARKLLPTLRMPASILCNNDFTACGVYRAAEELNLVIGKDLAVVGFDDIPMAKLLKPALTTVHCYPQKIGYQSAKLLHELIQGKVQSPVQIRIPVKLTVRESA